MKKLQEKQSFTSAILWKCFSLLLAVSFLPFLSPDLMALQMEKENLSITVQPVAEEHPQYAAFQLKLMNRSGETRTFSATIQLINSTTDGEIIQGQCPLYLSVEPFGRAQTIAHCKSNGFTNWKLFIKHIFKGAPAAQGEPTLPSPH